MYFTTKLGIAIQFHFPFVVSELFVSVCYRWSSFCQAPFFQGFTCCIWCLQDQSLKQTLCLQSDLYLRPVSSLIGHWFLWYLFMWNPSCVIVVLNFQCLMCEICLLVVHLGNRILRQGTIEDWWAGWLNPYLYGLWFQVLSLRLSHLEWGAHHRHPHLQDRMIKNAHPSLDELFALEERFAPIACFVSWT